MNEENKNSKKKSTLFTLWMLFLNYYSLTNVFDLFFFLFFLLFLTGFSYSHRPYSNLLLRCCCCCGLFICCFSNTQSFAHTSSSLLQRRTYVRKCTINVPLPSLSHRFALDGFGRVCPSHEIWTKILQLIDINNKMHASIGLDVDVVVLSSGSFVFMILKIKLRLVSNMKNLNSVWKAKKKNRIEIRSIHVQTQQFLSNDFY